MYLLWLVGAGVLLAAYISRRRKRKTSGLPDAPIKN